MAGHFVRRLFGPPGTGKTTTLSRRVAEAARSYSGLVAVTSFTRTAAVELKGRELPISDERVGTLHSMAFRALGASREQMVEGHPEARAEWNKAAPPGWSIAKKSAGAVDDPYADEAAGDDASESFDEYQLCRARRQTIPSYLAKEAERYASFKQSNDLLDFTDLIENCLEHRYPPPVDVAAWFHDETQDSTPLELALLREWAAGCPGGLTLAGDDQQAIYGFRGATPHAFLDGEAEEEVLGQSWRLPETIRSFAHAYGSTMDVHRPKDWVGQDREGAVVESDARLDSPEVVLEEIAHELEHEGSETVMLLATCSYMLHKILHVLRDDGIPFENPYRPGRKDWNPLGGGGSRRLRNFLDEGMNWAQAWSWIEMLDAKKSGMKNGAKKTLKEALSDPSFAKAPFQLYEYQAICGEELPAPGDMRWLRDHVTAAKWKTLLDYPLRVLEQHGMPALEKKPRVRVGTVHSVKGGEADSVILFPDISRRAWIQQIDDPDDVRRTFYVGMTRARRRLLLAGRSSRYAEDVVV